MNFNYDNIPLGFYDQIFDGKDCIRKYWHWHKFNSVLRSIATPNHPIQVLDVGCFSGSFAGRFLKDDLFTATSIDILKDQIQYAKEKFESINKRFQHFENFDKIPDSIKSNIYDIVTLIEVIEHLNPSQIQSFFFMLNQITRPGSQIIITTPNYLSFWPFLELLLNKFSDVSYEEQHITKFNFWNVHKILKHIYPAFNSEYKISFLTTSHFLSPFIAGINYSLGKKISTSFHPKFWKHPFGCIIILKLVRK